MGNEWMENLDEHYIGGNWMRRIQKSYQAENWRWIGRAISEIMDVHNEIGNGLETIMSKEWMGKIGEVLYWG